VLALGLAVRLRRPFAAAPVLLLALTLYFTYSRGAWLALAAGALAALGLSLLRMSRRVVLALPAVMICAGAIALGRVGAPSGAVLVHAAQDWDWELPALTLAGLGCAVARIFATVTSRSPTVARARPGPPRARRSTSITARGSTSTPPKANNQHSGKGHGKK
jgi:hypothetical protein